MAAIQNGGPPAAPGDSSAGGGGGGGGRVLAGDLLWDERFDVRARARERLEGVQYGAPQILLPTMTIYGGAAGSGLGPRAQMLRKASLNPANPITWGQDVYARDAALMQDETQLGTPANASAKVLRGLGLTRLFVGRFQKFIARLRRFGYPVSSFRITSALRTPERNQEVSGVSLSAHLWGEAVDFWTAYHDGHPLVVDSWDLAEAATRAKLQAIVYPRHIHVEISPDGRVGLAGLRRS